MASQTGTLENLAHELGVALQPLEQRLASGQLRGFLNELGIALPNSLASEATFIGAVGNAVTRIGELAPLIAQLASAIGADDTSQILSTAISVLTKVGQVLDAFATAANALHTAAGSAGALTPAQKEPSSSHSPASSRPNSSTTPSSNTSTRRAVASCQRST